MQSSSTTSTTKIATTSQISTTPDSKATQSSSAKSSTSTETSPKTDGTTTLQSDDNSKTSRSSSTQRESSSSQVVTDVSQKSDLNTHQTTMGSAANAEEDPYNYDISFHNVTIKVIPGSPYPKEIQCGFFNNLKVFIMNLFPNKK